MNITNEILKIERIIKAHPQIHSDEWEKENDCWILKTEVPDWRLKELEVFWIKEAKVENAKLKISVRYKEEYKNIKIYNMTIRMKPNNPEGFVHERWYTIPNN